MPGQLKHLVDWCSRPYGPEAALYGKPAAVIGASMTDYGALWAQDHLRKALGLAGARVTKVELPVGKAQEKFDETGKLTDQETIDQLEQVNRRARGPPRLAGRELSRPRTLARDLGRPAGCPSLHRRRR